MPEFSGNASVENEVMTLSVDAANEPHIVVNADRTVSVPEELKCIAVEHDHNVETVTFDCPRYWDEHDLSTMHIYIHYRCADGNIEPYTCKNLVVDSEDSNTIHFDWTISQNVTCAKGPIAFIIAAKKPNAAGELQNYWHSRLNKEMEVLEGLECNTDALLERFPDVLEQILIRLDDLEKYGGGTGSEGSAKVTADSIHTALGYVPANEEALQALDARGAYKPFVIEATTFEGSTFVLAGYTTEQLNDRSKLSEVIIRATDGQHRLVFAKVIPDLGGAYGTLYTTVDEDEQQFNGTACLVGFADRDGLVVGEIILAESIGGTAEVTSESISQALGYTPADSNELDELEVAFNDFGLFAGMKPAVFDSQIDGNTIAIAATMNFLTEYPKMGEVLIYGFAENKILAAKVYPKTDMIPTLAAVGTLYTQNGDSMDDYTAESCVIYLAENGDHVVGSIVAANTAISDAVKTEIAEQAAALVDTALLDLIGEVTE